MRAFSGVGESSRDVQQQFFYYIRYPDYTYTGRTNYSMKFCIMGSFLGLYTGGEM